MVNIPVKYIPKHFKAKELVSPAVYSKYGDNSLKFIDVRILIFLDTLRENLGVPIVVNGGGNTQRCLRENICPIVKGKTQNGSIYLSAHVLGRGVDISSPKMSAQDIFNHIVKNYSKYKYYINRLESDKVTCPKGYVHIDNMGTSEDLHIFNP